MMKIEEIRKDRFHRQIEAFRLRYVENLKLREVGERLGRVDGSGPICMQQARTLSDGGMRRLTHPSQTGHPLYARAMEVRVRQQERWDRGAKRSRGR